MSWEETRESRRIERSDDGSIHATRYVKVWGHSRESVLMRPNMITRPQPPTQFLQSAAIGDNYLDVPGTYDDAPSVRLWGYDIQVSPLSETVLSVEIRYSNDTRLIASKSRLPLAIQEKGRAGAWHRQTEPIPVARKVYIPVPGTSNYAVTWEELVDQVPSRIGRKSYSRLIDRDDMTRFKYRLTVLSQQNKIHKFEVDGFSEYLLFEGADYADYSPSYTLVTLYWTDDPGIVDADYNDTEYLRFPPKDKTWPHTPGVTYIRPPFHRLYLTKDGNNEPVWTAHTWTKYEPSGALLLMGFEVP